MPLRVLITVLVMFASSAASAEVPPRGRWVAQIAPPRPSLPAVEVAVGYPGGYVPTVNFPIDLRGRAGETGFNGYIGFHFRVGRNRTADVPVIARAVLRPHETWTFSTFASVRLQGGPIVPREIAIEWRNASMDILGVESGGNPEWTQPRDLRVLRISAGNETTALGRNVWSAPPDALSDQAQWYDGFSGVVAPLDIWTTLPRRVREAIVGSGETLVLFGLPGGNQQLDDLDRAILPVTFEERPGTYSAPWPYGDGRPVETPVSWTVKRDTSVLMGGPLPYLVRSEVASWAADQNGVAQPLPSTASIPAALAAFRAGGPDPNARITVATPRPATFARANPALLLTVAAGSVALLGWLLLRKTPRAIMLIVLLIGALAVVAARDRIRPQAGTRRAVIETFHAPGIVDVDQITRSWGPSPLAAESGDPEAFRLSRTSGGGALEDVEIRTSTTPPGMGAMRRKDDWHAVTRWSSRRTLGDAPPAIRTRRDDPKTLVVEYQSAFPVNSMRAEWLCGEGWCWGEQDLPWGTSGRATIRHGHTAWKSEDWNFQTRLSSSSATQVALVQNTRWSRRATMWSEGAAERPAGSFLISGRGVFALPAGISPDATALVSVRTAVPPPEVRVTWASGSTMLQPTGRQGLRLATLSYEVPTEVLGQIIAAGGIVRVTVDSDELAWKSIEVWEKRS